jgi:hypothetical protein
MKEAPGSSETSVLTRATRRKNPEDTILYAHVLSPLLLTFACLEVEWGTGTNLQRVPKTNPDSSVVQLTAESVFCMEYPKLSYLGFGAGPTAIPSHVYCIFIEKVLLTFVLIIKRSL